MPRGNQLRGEGGVFHLTHRCHNRAFLLKFARDRNAYRARLREHLHQFDMALLDYCLTSNHVHLLVDAEERLEVWTESLAVGSNSFVEKIQPLILSRRETEIVETDSTLWVLREPPAPYGRETGVESACKATK